MEPIKEILKYRMKLLYHYV